VLKRDVKLQLTNYKRPDKSAVAPSGFTQPQAANYTADVEHVIVSIAA